MILTGHRGAAKLEPENTLLSIQKAIDIGVDQIEIDVHLTSDQHLVVIHDTTVDRTTDGQGVIADFTLAEVKQLDAGKGERIPTLQEVLDLVRGKVILQIELKGPNTAAPVIQTVKQNGMESEVLLTSFVHERLHEARQLNPNLRLGALWANPPPDACEQAIDMGAEAIHIQHLNIDPELVQKAHANGLKIRAWNPDTVEEIQRVINLGVDAIGSNRPDLLIAAGRR